MNLTLAQFINTLLAGVTGFPGNMVRPKWQPEPPKQPPLATNWIAYGIISGTPDDNGYLGVATDGSSVYQRHEDLEIQCSFYGPDASAAAAAIRDGFQIPANRESLSAAKMAFISVGPMMTVPDLINERWVNRIEMSVYLRRMVQRSYAISTFLSASGTISTDTTPQYDLEWQTKT